MPDSVVGVKQCVIELNGAWQFSAQPAVAFEGEGLDKLEWSKVDVPNELAMQGISIQQDVEYLLRRTVEVPWDFATHRIVLRFDGVYSYARIWVNGHFVRDHHGGFTSWDCDITPYVRAGETADVLVGVTDRADDPSIGSTYAKHNIGGILRDVRLVALPTVHIAQVQLSASLDDSYRTGILDLALQLNATPPASAEAILSLRNPAGDVLPLVVHRHRAGASFSFDPIIVADVARWDSEHPNLYELVIELRNGPDAQTIKRQIGFRQIEHVGNRILVNGDPIVLRGICRHDIHPKRGRSPVREHDENDPFLLRKANINFVRTAHYPPTEAFLAACDRAGILVEEETAVCFAKIEAASDPALATRFVSQFEEMIARDHWHASVIIWSLGNESQWGANFRKELEFVRKADTDRPVIFSWPETLGWDHRGIDIYSSHYPPWDSELGSDDHPILHDEFAHIACYNLDDLRRDPGIRNFWGRSIARFGEKFVETPGCLGGAIWAGIDDIFHLPDNKIVGYGPWGILDGWRRQKPEFWLTRKAFSPIRLEDAPLPIPQPGEGPVLTITNGYDHSNLNTVNIEWQVNDVKGVIAGPDLAPHGTTQIRIPVSGLSEGQVLSLTFRTTGGEEIDCFRLPIGRRVLRSIISSPQPLKVGQSADTLELSGKGFVLALDRETGLIKHASINDKTVIEGGPFLDLGMSRQSGWTPRKIDWVNFPRSARMQVEGQSKFADQVVDLLYELEVFGDGRIDLRYRLLRNPDFKFSHLGMAFLLPRGIDRPEWDREALWSDYPADHIGHPRGTAQRISSRGVRVTGDAPDWPWAEDMYEPFLHGVHMPSDAATNDFRSLKENVYWAACFAGELREHIQVVGAGDIGVRASPTPEGLVALNIYNHWSFPDLKWGNYTGPSLPSEFRQKAAEYITPPENKISIHLMSSTQDGSS